MKHIKKMFTLFSSSCLYILFSLVILTSIPQISTAAKPRNLIATNNETDRSALLEFKSKITHDPFGVMGSWNSSIHFCHWYGVTCGRRHQRVTVLDLPSQELSGSISPHIGNLTFLRNLTIQGNSLSGEIPGESLGRLHRLKYLYLWNNSLVGEIPSNLSACYNLIDLRLSHNRLSGRVPVEIGSMINLQVLILQANSLTSNIPASFGNLSSLEVLVLKSNLLTGTIPQALGQLQKLKHLDLENNSLVGEIPSNLSGCYNLAFIGLSSNKILGRIPVEIGSLINLQELYIQKNNLTGNIPSSFGNLTSLEQVYLSDNHLSGTIPQTIGFLKNLIRIDFAVNDLEGTIPPSIFNLSALKGFGVGLNRLSGALPSQSAIFSRNLQFFGISVNGFIGPIPPSISNASNLVTLQLAVNNFTGRVPNLENLRELVLLIISVNELGSGGRDAGTRDLQFLSDLANNTNLETLIAGGNILGGTFPDFSNLSFPKLTDFSFESNQIVGTLPTAIGSWDSLQSLSLWGNRLSGGITNDIGKLQALRILYLHDNDFSGNIPPSIGNLHMLLELVLSGNKLLGTIPSSLGKCKSLVILVLSDNFLNGSIPKEVLTVSSLSLILNLSWNQLNGALPSEVGSLKNLGVFDVSHNMLSGEIPNSLGDCQSMETMDMSENLFQGKVPPSFASLRGLKNLNLSHNKMSGEIPSFLQSFHLEHLDLSFNNFSGKLPSEGIFENSSVTSLQGNNMLCGGTAQLHLPICITMEPKRRASDIWKPKLIVAIALSSLAMLLAFFLLFLLLSKRRIREIALSSSEDSTLQVQVSYQCLFEATDGFSTTNLIGKGSFSSVYKGVLDVQRIVAVKVFNLQRRGASRSFLVECEALRNIRHRNLVKVITVCSSIDSRGDDFKALVYEFMVNGNLDQWLHPLNPSSESTRKLDFVQRLNIIIDVACALNYLHCEHSQSPIVHSDLKPSNILLDDEMTAKVGDFGLMKFLSEEINQLSASSFGVRGTVGYVAPEYGMGSDVSTDGDVYSFGVLLLEMFTGKRPTGDIFDSNMNLHNYVKMALPEKVAEITEAELVQGKKYDSEKNVKTLIDIFEVGIACSKEMPRERMEIRDVLAKLIEIRDNLV